MQISLNTKWYENLWAALIFFTRLPFWRVHQPPRDAYRAVVEFWPLVGWLTGGVMAAIIFFGNFFLPNNVAVLLAIAVRVLLTGALHEDGLCDFFDGMGGGTSRERILAIMKDSRVGTYGVLGMVLYMLILHQTLVAMPLPMAAIAVLMADPYAKMLSAQVVQILPYARTEEEAKAKTVYRRMSMKAAVSLAIQGFLPMFAALWYMGGAVNWRVIVFGPCLVMYFLYLFMRRKLHGYTGDCCGALFLLIELAAYLCILSQVYDYFGMMDMLDSIRGV